MANMNTPTDLPAKGKALLAALIRGSQKWLLPVAAIFAHPFWAVFAFAGGAITGIHTGSTNVTMIWPGFVVASLVLFGVRREVYRWLAGPKEPWAKVAPYFYRPAWVLLLALPLVPAMFMPVEGNVAGFVYIPVLGILNVSLTPVVFIWDILEIRKARRALGRS